MHGIPNEDMATLWNGPSGQAWVDERALLDRTYENIEALLADAVSSSGARNVLDIGCGSGATSLAAARRLGTTGAVTGIDISAPLLAVARARAAASGVAARFIHADAQTYPFDRGVFDLLISRFGVMFFDDPMAAFKNLLLGTAPGGQLRLVVFRSMAENPFMTVAERAAGQYLPRLPPRRAGAPGQFAFADRPYVQKLLEDAGWAHAAFTPLDVPCSFPAADLERYSTRLGPVGQALREADESTRRRVIVDLRTAFQTFVEGPEVKFVAACWMISARCE